MLALANDSTSLIGFPRQMMNDERYFPEPRAFKPERFLHRPDTRRTKSEDEGGALAKDADPSSIIFGFGRR